MAIDDSISGSSKEDWGIERFNNSPIEETPIDLIDLLADEIEAITHAPDYRPWYCSLIKTYGYERVSYWLSRARHADEPGRYFSSYARKMQKALGKKPKQNIETEEAPSTTRAADVSSPVPETQEEIDKLVHDAHDSFISEDIYGRAIRWKDVDD